MPSKAKIFGYCCSNFDEITKSGRFSILTVPESTNKQFLLKYAVNRTTKERIKLIALSVLVNSLPRNPNVEYIVRVTDKKLIKKFNDDTVDDNIDNEPNIDIILSLMQGINVSGCELVPYRKYDDNISACMKSLSDQFDVTIYKDTPADAVKIK